MKRVLDLSLRSKIPLWGGMLMVLTALAIAGALLFRVYDDIMQDMRTGSAHLGRVLANTLFQTILHDDIWRAYELINAPLRGAIPDDPMQPEALLVVDTAGQIIVSTQPERMPMLSPLSQAGPAYARLAAGIARIDKDSSQLFEFDDAEHLYFATPIADRGVQLGTVVLAYDRAMFTTRFLASAWRAVVTGVLVMAVLLPLNWYWGRRMAVPLVELAGRMERIGGERLPEALDPALYPYRDELGKLFDAYAVTLRELGRKALLEKEIIGSERLAAVGQLSAGIAHEINNPLAGILTAVNTLKLVGDNNPRSLKTIALIERGLLQIKETVSALLVEARVNTRSLTPQDVDDVRILMQTPARKKSLEIEARGGIECEVPLPANLLRQIFINLLLNAVQAANDNGVVWFDLRIVDGQLRFEVANDGREISETRRARLFEPFSSDRPGGHGLGLWVTYQIVQQLGGRIAAHSDDGLTHFVATLPLGTPPESEA